MSRWKARSAVLAAISQICCEGLGLLRNILLARLIGPSEMGVFATLAMTISLLDMISDLGPDRLMVQAEDGDSQDFQSTAQALLLSRGFFSGILLMILAIPLASLLGNISLTWMVAALAGVVVLRGALHLDCKRTQRDHDFRRTVLVELVSAVLTTLAVIVFAGRIHDASAFVWISLLQALSMVAISHLVASRRYSLKYNRSVASRLFHFGWPLALNSLIMFGALQGDRIVILATTTVTDLGRYSVAFQLTMVPTLLISRIASTVLLPVLARCQRQPDVYARRLELICAVLGVTALCFTVTVSLVGNRLIGLLYGQDFQISTSTIVWLAAMQGIRILRSVPSITAMSKADSFNPLISNILRLTGIIAAAFAGFAGAGLSAIAAAGFAGEVIALSGSLVLLQRRHGISVRPLWSSFFQFTLAMIAEWSILTERSVGAVSVCAGGLICVLICSALWRILRFNQISRVPGQVAPVAELQAMLPSKGM